MPTGTRLTLTGVTGLAGAVARAFIPDRYDTEKAVARGYQGILTVTVDGREATVDVLPANALTEADTAYDKLAADIVGDYEGNLVRIRIGNAKPRGYHSTGLVANWYGQLVNEDGVPWIYPWGGALSTFSVPVASNVSWTRSSRPN